MSGFGIVTKSVLVVKSAFVKKPRPKFCLLCGEIGSSFASRIRPRVPERNGRIASLAAPRHLSRSGPLLPR